MEEIINEICEAVRSGEVSTDVKSDEEIAEVVDFGCNFFKHEAFTTVGLLGLTSALLAKEVLTLRAKLAAKAEAA